MFNRQRVQWLVCAALLNLVGCLGFDSVHPLSAVQDAKPDQRLIGEWTSKHANNIVYTVSLAGTGFPKGMHRMIVADGNESETGYFFISKIGDDQFLNVVRFSETETPPKKWDASKVTNYGLLGYRVVDDQCQLIPLQEKFIKQAIQKKMIKGEVVQDEALDHPLLNKLSADAEDEAGRPNVEPENLDEIEMRLTATTAELHSFIKRYRDDVLSKEFETLERKPAKHFE